MKKIRNKPKTHRKQTPRMGHDTDNCSAKVQAIPLDVARVGGLTFLSYSAAGERYSGR